MRGGGVFVNGRPLRPRRYEIECPATLRTAEPVRFGSMHELRHSSERSQDRATSPSKASFGSETSRTASAPWAEYLKTVPNDYLQRWAGIEACQ